MTDPMPDLERQYDGPIPAEVRAEALAGGRLPLALRRARGEMRGWFTHGPPPTGLIHDTIDCLRAARRLYAIWAKHSSPTNQAVSDYGARRIDQLHDQLVCYRHRRKDALRHLIRLQRQERAQRQNAQGIHRDIIAPLRRTVTHSLGSLSVDAAVEAACRVAEPEDAA